MANASIAGLASGLDTTGIIDALMTLEGAQRSQLQVRVESENRAVSALQTLNTDAAVLASRAEALAKPAAWQALSASSSAPGVTATAGADARPGSLSLTVVATAATHLLGFSAPAARTDVVVPGGTTVRLEREGSVLELDTGDGTLDGLVAALNDPANQTGVRATLVRADASGTQHRLLVESVETGAAQAFRLTGADGSALLGGSAERPGADAVVDLGAGVVAASPTNTFTALLPGLDVTLGSGAAAGTTTTLTVAHPAASMTSAVSGLVDGLNALLARIDTQASQTAAGPLAADPTVRSLRSALLDAVYPGDGGTLADVGIQLDRSGRFTLDTARLAAAYAEDPEKVAAMFTGTGAEGGFAARVAAVTSSASNSTDGALTQAITGRRSTIDRLEDGIEAWDLRLELRRSTLERQYAALEVSMSNLSAQSTWLSGQLAALTAGQD